MEKDGEPLYDKVLDESDLHEEGAIQFKNERRYEIY
jgi:hypothetical protein